MKNKNDPKHYWEMSKPFEIREDAEKAIDNFLDAVEKARNDFHIKDVHVIVMVDTTEGPIVLDAHFGDTMLSIPMLKINLKILQSKSRTVNK